MNLSSSAFQDSTPIPAKYTGEGADISPPLDWSDVPKNTKEYALILEDPDAPSGNGENYPFVHWIAYNFSPNVSSIPEGLPSKAIRIQLPVSLDQGINSFHQIGYSGPMPPIGSGLHHYRFTLYALDAELGVKPPITKEQLLKAIDGHTIATANLIGTYQRNKDQKSA